ncbi:phage major tail tube protein [Paenibacillus macquariensis]|uniref:Phage tail protein n=1 Tax=Paenibacillus macquariensis TaxID=948756 RepID=A0ABY1K769_9BACL|nr:phage major tail tube protein [Paenibacillus macquariensis]MEC0092501.1 phage major tail tube protein [Paenibacillus macquariensis]OAB35459.1 hypothetical protein PMSM_09390 [Paenibacillus macquariensis subsp. macquariensis]SIR35306.1 hypothetical protein SAMN05421578_111165 [Paenibacillus macquariensis]
MAQIPVKLQAAAVYLEDSSIEVATGDVTLPSFDSLSETLSGAGILGEIDVPTPGHFGSMEVGINWRTIQTEAVKLISSEVHALDIRGAFQIFNQSGKLETKGIKVTIRAMGKGLDLGKLAQNSTTDTTTTLEVVYIKIFIDGIAVIELDKLNYVFRVNGQDDLLDVRKILGKS